jgi:hypothetical protein
MSCVSPSAAQNVGNWIPEGEAAVCEEYKGKKVIDVI